MKNKPGIFFLIVIIIAAVLLNCPPVKPPGPADESNLHYDLTWDGEAFIVLFKIIYDDVSRVIIFSTPFKPTGSLGSWR